MCGCDFAVCPVWSCVCSHVRLRLRLSGQNLVHTPVLPRGIFGVFQRLALVGSAESLSTAFSAVTTAAPVEKAKAFRSVDKVVATPRILDSKVVALRLATATEEHEVLRTLGVHLYRTIEFYTWDPRYKFEPDD